MEVARPSTNHFAADRDPAATRRAVLRVLIDYGPLTRREAARLVYGTDLAGASNAASAVGWLRNVGYVERLGGYRLRVTDAGRDAYDTAMSLGELDPLAALPACAEETSP